MLPSVLSHAHVDAVGDGVVAKPIGDFLKMGNSQQFGTNMRAMMNTPYILPRSPLIEKDPKPFDPGSCGRSKHAI